MEALAVVDINFILIISLQIEASKLFSNIEEIYTINLAFWMANLSKVVENVSNFSTFHFTVHL